MIRDFAADSYLKNDDLEYGLAFDWVQDNDKGSPLNLLAVAATARSE